MLFIPERPWACSVQTLDETIHVKTTFDPEGPLRSVASHIFVNFDNMSAPTTVSEHVKKILAGFYPGQVIQAKFLDSKPTMLLLSDYGGSVVTPSTFERDAYSHFRNNHSALTFFRENFFEKKEIRENLRDDVAVFNLVNTSPKVLLLPLLYTSDTKSIYNVSGIKPLKEIIDPSFFEEHYRNNPQFRKLKKHYRICQDDKPGLVAFIDKELLRSNLKALEYENLELEVQRMMIFRYKINPFSS